MNKISRSGFSGHLKGTVECFYGIQYAELRSGRRFGATSVLDEDRQIDAPRLEDVPIFPQLPSRLATSMGSRIAHNPQSESAFFLNVWAPTLSEGLPVLVFIHGGAWMTGGGSAPWYDGEAISALGVVVVTFNYRIGPLAHLRDEGSSDERNPAFSDVLCAMRWVQENIARFGGDPAKVTVAGQSAGSWYAHLLSISESARGLLSRVAYLSHASNRPWSAAYQDQFSSEVQQELGTGTLQDVEHTELLVAAKRVLGQRPQEFGSVPTPYLPTADEATADLFCSAAESARVSHAEAVYIRTTGTETSSFFFDSPQARGLSAEAAAAVLTSLWSACVGTAEVGAATTAATPYEELLAVTSELHFDGPSRKLADAFALQGTPAYLRVFDLESELDGFRSGHCFDLPFQFGQFEHWADAPMLTGVSRDEFDRVSEILMSELVAFASASEKTCGLKRHVDGALAEPMMIRT